jgi:predicted aconitase
MEASSSTPKGFHQVTDLQLSDQDQRMLDGEMGEATQIAMRILTRIAYIQGAAELIDISHVHVGGSIYTGPGSLHVVETLAKKGAKVRVPTTINAISIDRERWKEQNVDEGFAHLADRLATAFEEMGASPVFSCTPYIFPEGPTLGQDIVWAESNAIAYANGVLGARTNRHGDFLDICAAITGRAPLAGMHLGANRSGTFVINVPPLTNLDGSFYTALGYLVGKLTGDLVPIVSGLKEEPSLEDLKSFCAAAASSGAVGMFHMVGITPEAPTLEVALGGREPLKITDITKEDLIKVRQDLSSGDGAALDAIVLGSPHFTLGDCSELAALVTGKRANPNIDILITTSRFVLSEARTRGWADPIEKFGARFSTDTCLCMLNENSLKTATRTVMTNSGKFAHYGPGLIRCGVYFGALSDCVDSAVAGRPIIRAPQWTAG